MERIKNVIGDVVVYGVCLISIAEIMNAVFDWLFYVQDTDEKVPFCPLRCG